MTAISLPFAAAGSRRAPDASELSNGFPCGPADIELFNWLNWWATGQIASVISKSGKVVDDAILTHAAEAIRSQRLNWVPVVGGTANALTITLDPAPASLADLVGVPIRLKAAVANTASVVTLSVNGLTPTQIIRPAGTLRVGDIVAGAICEVVYDGATFRALSLPRFGVTSGTGWIRFSDADPGLLIQSGNGGTSAGGPITITLPVSHSSTAYRVFVTDESSPASPVGMSVFGTGTYAVSGFQVFGTRDFTNFTADSFNWLTIGY